MNHHGWLVMKLTEVMIVADRFVVGIKGTMVWFRILGHQVKFFALYKSGILLI